MAVVYWVCFAILGVSAFLVLLRVERGPSMLDRSVAVDVVTASLIGFVAVVTAYQRRADLMALMAALALVGFCSTVVISRFAAAESDDERRILTPAEAARALWEEANRPDDAEEAHTVDYDDEEDEDGDRDDPEG